MGEGNEHQPLTMRHTGESILFTEGGYDDIKDSSRYVERGSTWQRRTSSTLRSGRGYIVRGRLQSDAAESLLRGRGNHALLGAYSANEGTTLFAETAAEGDKDMDEDSTMGRVSGSYTTRKERGGLQKAAAEGLLRGRGHYALLRAYCADEDTTLFTETAAEEDSIITGRVAGSYTTNKEWGGLRNVAAEGLLRGRGHYALLRAYCADEDTTLFTGTAAEGDKDTEEGGVMVSGITEDYMRKERLRIRCWWYEVLERKGAYYFCEGGCMGGRSASEGGVRLSRTCDDNLGGSTYDRGAVYDGEGLPGGWTLHRSSNFGAFAWAVLFLPFFSGAGPCAAKATAAHSPEVLFPAGTRSLRYIYLTLSGAGLCAAKVTAAHSPEGARGRCLVAEFRMSCALMHRQRTFSRSALVSEFRVFFFEYIERSACCSRC